LNYFAILNQPIDKDNDIEFHGKYIHFEQHYALAHWKPYDDKENHIKMFILGKPAIEMNEWTDYKVGEASYITRLLIQKYIQNDLNQFCSELNGAFTILILDDLQKRLIVVTDKLGIYPVYENAKKSIRDFQLSTHSDILANHLVETTLDEVSVAEFLKRGFINIPNTYYNECKTLEHSCCYIWDFGKEEFEYRKYFDFKSNYNYDIEFLVNKLSSSLLHAIQRRTNSYYGKKAVLLSGGADSRVILYNAVNDTDAITLYNIENTEIKTAKEISNILNSKHHLIQREFDHYIDILDKSVLGSGGTAEITSEHYLTYKDNDIFTSYDQLLTGCYFDYMFKGLSLNTKNISLFGKTLHYKVLSEIDSHYYTGIFSISSQYDLSIRERENHLFENYSNLTELESKRSFPLFRESDAIMRLSLIRFFQADFVAADNDLIDCFLVIPPKYKINSQVFGQAVARITQKINHIPHANTNIKIGTHPYIFVIKSLIDSMKKKLKRDKKGILTGEGSWINFIEYARKSKKVAHVWNSIDQIERDIIIKILNYDPWSKGKEYILNQKDGHNLLFRIITFCKWHEMYRNDQLLKQ
jgi:asparagine synthase (glutamine-hydrolysing)